jgi:hypothetical protein
MISVSIYEKWQKNSFTSKNVGDSLSGHSFKLLETQRLQGLHIQVSKLWRHHGTEFATANDFKNLLRQFQVILSI